jgi:zinc transport system ATP-binding protein
MLVQVSKVSYAYDENSVLSNISFNIKEGDFVALIGRNGSGKTTLMKLMLGLLKIQKGSIRVFGKKISRFKEWGLVGYVPQKYNIDRNFPASVDEILSLRNDSQKARVISMLHISDILRKKFSDLSGGQQQKVIIALSLMSSPKLLILDEPTVGVDIKAQQEFYDLLKKLNKETGATIILVTHDVGLVSKYVNNVICLNGNICCCGKAHETEKLLKQVYGKNFQIHHH